MTRTWGFAFILVAALFGGCATEEGPPPPRLEPDAGPPPERLGQAEEGGVGASCGECAPGLRCMMNAFVVIGREERELELSGGYCSLSCSLDVCPPGSTCTGFSSEGMQAICAHACTDNSSCRDGYVCEAIAGGAIEPVPPNNGVCLPR